MSRAVIIIKHDADRTLAAKWAAKIPAGSTIEFRAPRRSGDQNALLWSMLGQISKQVEWYGEKRSSEDWKDIFTAAYRKARVVPGIDPGTVVALGMRTSQMTKEEISELIELINAWAAERGVTFREYQGE